MSRQHAEPHSEVASPIPPWSVSLVDHDHDRVNKLHLAALTSNIASTKPVIEENTAKFESMAVPSEDTYRGGMRQVACPKCGCPTTCVEDDACDECGECSHIRECAACAWYAYIRCAKAAQEARLPREARRRRGRGRHRW